MLELFKKFRLPLIAGCLVLAALLIFTAHLRRGMATTFFERQVMAAAGPLQEGLSWLRGLFGRDGEAERLRAENRQLQAELVKMEELRQENERLTWLLALRDELPLPTLAARVIADDAAPWSRTVVINRGLTHGVREGMPVVVVEGVVGRVLRASARQSRVLLVTDASSALAVLDQRTRARGICRGDGSALSFEYAVRDEEIEPGDVVITAGTGGVFPSGLIVGRINRVNPGGSGLFQGVTVTPAVDFDRLEEVLVLLREPGP